MEPLVVQWGDVATWVASVVAVLSFVYLIVSNVQGRKKAERAEKEARSAQAALQTAEVRIDRALEVITGHLEQQRRHDAEASSGWTTKKGNSSKTHPLRTPPLAGSKSPNRKSFVEELGEALRQDMETFEKTSLILRPIDVARREERDRLQARAEAEALEAGARDQSHLPHEPGPIDPQKFQGPGVGSPHRPRRIDPETFQVRDNGSQRRSGHIDPETFQVRKKSTPDEGEPKG